jgi:transcriptional antiterminator RfaH
MELMQTVGSTDWYIIRTLPKQETRADGNLRAWGVETFAPIVKEHRVNSITGATTFITKPLFPGYIFARFNIERLFHKVGFTRGVHSVVGFGSGPTPVGEEVVALIKERIQDDGFVKIGEDFHPGEKVVIKNGLLKNFTGVFQRGMKGSDRAVILLTTVNYQGSVTVDRVLLEKAG